MAILSVLPVMTWIRDMFYRHRDSGMYDSLSMGIALGVAEKWFILLSSTLFTVVFLAVAGILPQEESAGHLVIRSIAFFVSCKMDSPKFFVIQQHGLSCLSSLSNFLVVMLHLSSRASSVLISLCTPISGSYLSVW